MENMIINLKNLTFHYYDDVGITDINLDIREGEIFGFEISYRKKEFSIPYYLSITNEEMKRIETIADQKNICRLTTKKSMWFFQMEFLLPGFFNFLLIFHNRFFFQYDT